MAIHRGSGTLTSMLSGLLNFKDEAIKAAEVILGSGKVNYLTGPKGMEFEKGFAGWVGRKYAISLATGTTPMLSISLERMRNKQ